MQLRTLLNIEENQGETMIRKTWTFVALGLVFAPSLLSGQSNTPAKNDSASKAVKAQSVTINMPEGMTRDEADAILNELRQIHRLLQNQRSRSSFRPQ